MNELHAAIRLAGEMLAGSDPVLFDIVSRSLLVSLSATLLASVLGLMLAAGLVVRRFRGRAVVLVLLNTAMGLPPVVVGLLIYLLLSRAGPLGGWGLLFSPGAMVIAQVTLVTPLIAALGRQVLEDTAQEYGELLKSLGATRTQQLATLLWEARYSLLTVILAGFGRAIAEVGAVLIVGGNIAHVTRVMTTAIAMETSRGNLALALALGLVLILTAVAVNLTVFTLQSLARRQLG